MRYRLAALMLFNVLAMGALAAPAPAPSAILDIGSPPKGKTAEEHLQDEIGHLSEGMLLHVWADPEIKKLKSVAGRRNPFTWLQENLRFTPDGGSHLRLTFRAGNNAEQVVILNSLLRAYLRLHEEKRQRLEKILRETEEGVSRLIKVIDSGEDPRQDECNRESLKRSQANIPKRRAQIARLKQIAVIRWAR